MKDIIQNLIQDLEAFYHDANKELEEDGSPPLKPLEVRILGQFSLILNKEVFEELQPGATVDVDALLSGDSMLKLELKRRLRKYGLEYDELSEEIWIPKGATYSEYYSSEALTILIIAPFITLTAKAKFAVTKNKQLLIRAIAIYEDKLLGIFKEHDVDIESLISEVEDEG